MKTPGQRQTVRQRRENGPVGDGKEVCGVDGGSAPSPGAQGGPCVLALDLGVSTGWAMRLSSGVIVSGCQTFKNGRFDGGGMRFLRFQGWLQEIRSHGITQVAYEEVRRHKGVDASHVYGGFQAHLTAFCEQYQIPYEGIPVGTIKLHATGKGNASKNLVIGAMRLRGYNPADDNEADALALLHYVLSQLKTIK
jgi:hypothetical protein